MWSRRRAAEILAEPDQAGLAAAVRAFPRQAPLADLDASRLAAVRSPVLVLAQEEDAAHPLGAARRCAQLIPGARLEVFPAGGVPWCARARLRETVTDFLGQ